MKKKPIGLYGLHWKNGKIVDSEGKDLTDKVKGVGGKETFETTKDPGEKPFEKYVLKRLHELKNMNQEYQQVNSYVLLAQRSWGPAGCQ